MSSSAPIHVDAEAAFRLLADNLSDSHSARFFAALSELLARILGVDHVSIVEICADDPDYAESLAMYSLGAPAPDIRYSLRGTPCENVLNENYCVFPEGVCQRFPDDALLQELGAESYFGVPMLDKDDKPLGLVAVLHNTPGDFSSTAREVIRVAAAQASSQLAQSRAESSLRESERRLSALMNNLPGVVYRCRYDDNWTMDFMSRGVKQLTGYRSEQLINNNELSYASIIHPDDQKKVAQEVESGLHAGNEFKVAYRILHADGELRWVWEHGQIILDDEENVLHIEGFITDITERQQQHEKIWRLAYRDAVTDLPNRFAFTERLAELYQDATYDDESLALLVLDLQRFKEINDHQGFHVGDLLLRAVSQRLQSMISDDEYVARFAGDEFALIIKNYQQGDHLAVTQRVRQMLEEPFVIGDREFKLQMTIGIASSDDSSSPQSLLQAASIALHQAKQLNTDLCVYDERLATQIIQRQYQTQRFIKAIENEKLTIQFQPQIALQTGKLVGAEVLCRWHDEELGQVPPDIFIGIAREQGLLDKLGDFVMQQSCQQIRTWQEQFGGGVSISLNLAVQQLDNPNLVEQFVKLRGDIPPQLLTLEITESDLMVDPEQATRITNDLVNAGFRLAVDDFGTGYSSLAYLQRFAIDYLKIDMSFVQDMIEDRHSQAIVSTIIAMAKNLGLRTIAEGVETEAQARILRAAGCDFAQGYYFDRPMAAAQFAAKWLAPAVVQG
ncbi:hypothetical protein IDSA_11345 [Pseudidiomarina salinarum]|uniref:Diguanylate cyclase n=1 Tax=Pseudidiomarina salinarum TaxID=435908 RepID=A0A094IWD5_9GAMM|nr:EAL domain-containing protein [Pseudidiomarina salinarum]KFZ30149.1 hypothetical protein IDSA_11345 [Pseudidiomarina salinarum]RUO68652.1 bifunctional diguanylate cyclase/phosphodiesterase [Pseudidiomarina salinarum]